VALSRFTSLTVNDTFGGVQGTITTGGLKVILAEVLSSPHSFLAFSEIVLRPLLSGTELLNKLLLKLKATGLPFTVSLSWFVLAISRTSALTA